MATCLAFTATVPELHLVPTGYGRSPTSMAHLLCMYLGNNCNYSHAAQVKKPHCPCQKRDTTTPRPSMKVMRVTSPARRVALSPIGPATYRELRILMPELQSSLAMPA